MVPFAFFIALFGYFVYNKRPVYVHNDAYWRMTWKTRGFFWKRVLAFFVSLSPIIGLYLIIAFIGQTMTAYIIAWPMIALMSYILIF